MSTILLQPGDVVTLTYDSYSKNAIPVNPVISHVRKDITWEHVLRDFGRSGAPGIFLFLFLFPFSSLLFFFLILYYLFFLLCSFCLLSSLCPIHSFFFPSYSFILFFFCIKKCAEIVQSEPVPVKPQGYWVAEKGKNMRLALIDFARSHNFDPLVAENWYPILPIQRQV